jgi:hypothetical protein
LLGLGHAIDVNGHDEGADLGVTDLPAGNSVDEGSDRFAGQFLAIPLCSDYFMGQGHTHIIAANS